jgi:hypothetical protein
VNLNVLHYHLLPGGVTSVITEGLQAILDYIPGIDKTTLISGTKENSTFVAERIERYLSKGKRSKKIIAIDILPEISYSHVQSGETIYQKLLQRCRPNTVWWIHNYHIGKNPAFTWAVIKLAETRPDQKILLHIHDFPECARFENLQKLKASNIENLYPRSDNIRYIVINSRDRDLLLHGGLSKKQVHLVENPFKAAQGERIEGEAFKQRLYHSYHNDFPAFDPKAPLLLYPVRTIRRKNVLEAGYLNRLFADYLHATGEADGCNLVVTLPGVSDQEKAYSKIVQNAFNQNLISGLWGIGSSLEDNGLSFSNLISASDLIFSSSIQEGFGYLFIQAVAWEKPLMARQLETLGGLEKIFCDFPHHFYQNVIIPADSSRLQTIRNELKIKYREKIRSAEEFLGLEQSKTLLTGIDKYLNGDYLEFSFLDINSQIEILKSMDDTGFRNDCLDLNSDILKSFYSLLKSQTHNTNKDIIESVFGYQQYGENFKKIMESFKDSRIAKASSSSTHRQLLSSFTKPEYLRLLYS